MQSSTIATVGKVYFCALYFIHPHFLKKKIAVTILRLHFSEIIVYNISYFPPKGSFLKMLCTSLENICWILKMTKIVHFFLSFLIMINISLFAEEVLTQKVLRPSNILEESQAREMPFKTFILN